MLSIDIRRLIGMMTATWFVVAACGGDSTGGGGGTGGTNGIGGSTGAGGAIGVGGAGVGGAGTGGTPVLDAGNRIPCGTANMSTGCNPMGNNRVCDLPNNRCVQCQTNADCLANPAQMGQPICDTVGMNGAGLPNFTCEECVVDADCTGAGMACVGNNCVATCATDADCATNMNGDLHCNTTTTMCVECVTNAHCVGMMSGAGVAQPFCRLVAMGGGGGGVNTCRTCLMATDCPIAGSTCNGGGNCVAPMVTPDAGPAVDTGAPAVDSGTPAVDAASGG